MGLKELLIGLSVKGVKSIRIYIPDTFFINGDILEVFITSRHDFRLTKLPGTIPLKHFIPTLTHLKNQSKYLQLSNQKKNLMDTLPSRELHSKYFDRLIPSHFHDGYDCKALNRNKHTFQKYILHENEKYTIEEI